MLKSDVNKQRKGTSMVPSSQVNDSMKEDRSILSVIQTILWAIISGVLFGFFMNKATVFFAPTIRMQMLFQRFAMLKMFLAAVGASMLSVTLLTLCRKALYEKILNGYIENNNRRGSKFIDAFDEDEQRLFDIVLHYVFGGSLIGLGMVISGSCPGTVFVQM